MVSSVISWTLFFGCLEFEGVRISIWCWGLRPLLQVGEIPESNTCLEKKICILFGFDANKLHPAYWVGSRRVGSDSGCIGASIDHWVSVHVVMTGVVFMFFGARHLTSTLTDSPVTFSFDS